MEKFVNAVSVMLSGRLDTEQIRMVRNVLFLVLKDYNLERKSTEIVVYNGELPDEVKAYMVSRKIEGLSDGTLIQYARTLKSFFARVNKAVQDVKTEDIRVYLYEIQKRHDMGNRSLDTQRIYLNAFFAWVYRE